MVVVERRKRREGRSEKWEEKERRSEERGVRHALGQRGGSKEERWFVPVLSWDAAGSTVKLHITVSVSWEFLLHDSLGVVSPTLASDIFILCLAWPAFERVFLDRY